MSCIESILQWGGGVIDYIKTTRPTTIDSSLLKGLIPLIEFNDNYNNDTNGVRTRFLEKFSAEGAIYEMKTPQHNLFGSKLYGHHNYWNYGSVATCHNPSRGIPRTVFGYEIYDKGIMRHRFYRMHNEKQFYYFTHNGKDYMVINTVENSERKEIYNQNYVSIKTVQNTLAAWLVIDFGSNKIKFYDMYSYNNISESDTLLHAMKEFHKTFGEKDYDCHKDSGIWNDILNDGGPFYSY